VRPFTPPRPRVERGDCWVRLLRLDASTLEDIEAAFLERNPNSFNIQVNPFTGLVESAAYARPPGNIPPNAPSDPGNLEKRIEPLLRNAELIGMKTSDVRRLVWFDDAPGHEMLFASLRLEHTAFSSIRTAEIGWYVQVALDGDRVSSFTVERRGPPFDFCTQPAFAVERVRSSSAIQERLESVRPSGMGEPELDIYARTDRQRPGAVPSSKTWLLAWRVRVNADVVVLDASTGEYLADIPPLVF